MAEFGWWPKPWTNHRGLVLLAGERVKRWRVLCSGRRYALVLIEDRGRARTVEQWERDGEQSIGPCPDGFRWGFACRWSCCEVCGHPAWEHSGM